MSYMSPLGFTYMKILSTDDSDEVGSVLAYRLGTDRQLQSVIWDATREIWMYAPAIAGQFIYDPELLDVASEIDRSTAERISRTILGSELPSEAKLNAMCEEGERMGWLVGPPPE
jgi:hypothetical protein